jgi:hypothetical protein
MEEDEPWITVCSMSSTILLKAFARTLSSGFQHKWKLGCPKTSIRATQLYRPHLHVLFKGLHYNPQPKARTTTFKLNSYYHRNQSTHKYTGGKQNSLNTSFVYSIVLKIQYCI